MAFYDRRIETVLSREIAELRYLAKNPGIWGGPLDRGECHSDLVFRSWERDGLVEARRKRDGKWGYWLTEKGHQFAYAK
jgi:hypothetical protein